MSTWRTEENQFVASFLQKSNSLVNGSTAAGGGKHAAVVSVPERENDLQIYLTKSNSFVTKFLWYNEQNYWSQLAVL